jgi:hypothetical protein
LNVSGSTSMTGSLIISSSAAYDLTVIDGMQVSGSTGRVTIGTSGFVTTTPSTNVGSYVNVYSLAQTDSVTGDELGLTLDTDAYGISGWSGPAIYGNNPSDLYPALIGFQNKASWTDGRTTFLTPISASAGIIGNTILTGSLTLTGSAHGNVNSASITSNTASIDFSKANYFEVTASVTPLYLDITNITKGTTSTLIISASASSSIKFSPNVAQPSPGAYSGSAAASVDILSFVAFNNSRVNLVATKNIV